MEQQIKNALEEIAEQQISDERDLWPTLQTKLSKKNQPRQNFPRTSIRLGRLLPTLAIFSLLVTIAYALSPVIQTLLEQDAGLNTVNSNGLGHSLNLQQVVDNVTVTLDWAYADENRIAVGYIISAENGHQYVPTDFTLTDNAGNVFPSGTGLVVTGPSDVIDSAVPEGEGAYVFSFDSSSITNKPQNLDLQLDIWLKSQVTEEVIGSVLFYFEIPFTPGRVAEPKQNYTAEGVTITLEKVVLTPSDLTTVICFEGPDDGYNEWLPISRIDVKNGEAEARATIGSQSNPDEVGCTTNHYFPSLYDYNGSWTLTVTELVGINVGYSENGEPQSDQLRVSGEWTFEFELP